MLPGVSPNYFWLANRDDSVFWRRYNQIIEHARVNKDLEVIFYRFDEDEWIVGLQDDHDIVETDLVLQALKSDRVVTCHRVGRRAHESKELPKLDDSLSTILSVNLRYKVVLVYHDLFVGRSGDGIRFHVSRSLSAQIKRRVADFVVDDHLHCEGCISARVP